jgi:hypothetical protein
VQILINLVEFFSSVKDHPKINQFEIFKPFCPMNDTYLSSICCDYASDKGFFSDLVFPK